MTAHIYLIAHSTFKDWYLPNIRKHSLNERTQLAVAKA